jgi:hypothetical protein
MRYRLCLLPPDLEKIWDRGILRHGWHHPSFVVGSNVLEDDIFVFQSVISGSGSEETPWHLFKIPEPDLVDT